MEPIRFRCSSCNQSLRSAGEKAGRTVRCTRCQTPVVVPIPEEDGTGDVPFVPLAAEETVTDPPVNRTHARQSSAAVDDDNPDDADEADRIEEAREAQPRKRKKRRRADAWRLTRFGLLLLIGAAGVSLFSVLLGLIFHFIPLGTLQSMMASLWVYLWVGVAISVISSLIQVAGFGLCLFAPRESGAWPFAAAALIATMLTGLAAPLLLWWEIGFEAPNLDPAHLQKEAENYRKNPQEQMKKLDEQMKKLSWQTQLLSLGQIVATLLHGVLLVSVPLLLRALCRTLRLSESEVNCDNLLKIGAAILAIGLVMRLLGMFLVSLLMAVSGFAALLHLVWTVMYVVLLVQIWRAMPGGGRSRKGLA
jgi:phage FluMu protein Com